MSTVENMQRSEDNLQDLVLSFYHVRPRDWIQVIKLSCKHLHPNGLLINPELLYFYKIRNMYFYSVCLSNTFLTSFELISGLNTDQQGCMSPWPWEQVYIPLFPSNQLYNLGSSRDGNSSFNLWEYVFFKAALPMSALLHTVSAHLPRVNS